MTPVKNICTMLDPVLSLSCTLQCTPCEKKKESILTMGREGASAVAHTPIFFCIPDLITPPNPTTTPVPPFHTPSADTRRRMGKSKCPSGQRWQNSIGACRAPCRKGSRRSMKYPYGCKLVKSCSKSNTGKRRVYISKAGKCMSPCKKGKRRSTVSPYKCRTPCKGGKRRSTKTGLCV